MRRAQTFDALTHSHSRPLPMTEVALLPPVQAAACSVVSCRGRPGAKPPSEEMAGSRSGSVCWTHPFMSAMSRPPEFSDMIFFFFFFFPFPLTSAEQMRHRQSRPSPETLPRTFATYQIEEAAGAAVQIKRCYSIKRSSYRKRNNLCKPRWMQFAHVAWKFSMLIRVWLRLSISWPPLWRWYLGWAITQHKLPPLEAETQNWRGVLMETKLNWMNQFNHKRKVRICLII